MRDNRRILVVGAGLSGMVLATALKRAGTAVDIVEVHPRWQVLGVGISVQGPALREVIAAATHEAGVEVRFGRTVNGLMEEGGRVEVEFSDGAQRSYDLVVGADGAGSRLREPLFGAAHRPQYRHADPAFTVVPRSRPPHRRRRAHRAAAPRKRGDHRHRGRHRPRLGEWEKAPDLPGADPTALISASMKTLAAPI